MLSLEWLQTLEHLFLVFHFIYPFAFCYWHSLLEIMENILYVVQQILFAECSPVNEYRRPLVTSRSPRLQHAIH
jgi:hypothetical protein